MKGCTSSYHGPCRGLVVILIITTSTIFNILATFTILTVITSMTIMTFMTYFYSAVLLLVLLVLGDPFATRHPESFDPVLRPWQVPAGVVGASGPFWV